MAKAPDQLAILKDRFEKNMQRHKGLKWSDIEPRLQGKTIKALAEMERTGGEPDVIGFDRKENKYLFCDCSTESPAGRRSLCYDKVALDARKENKPKGSAQELASSFGAELLTEKEYRQLQTLGEFDTKTSSWIKTHANIRKLGGALFCDRRYGTVFVYHNGADSYYAARGFRCIVRV